MRGFWESHSKSPGGRVTQGEYPAGAIAPGTPMLKVIPPRLVEPYLNGQRLVIAGYIYRAQDCAFQAPADFYHALALGYPGSDFTPDLPEVCLLRWLAQNMSGSLVPPFPDGGYGPGTGPAATVPEFFTLPVPVPVGADICRVTQDGEELMGRFDGQAWLPPARRH
jgi:hypothetical protein